MPAQKRYPDSLARAIYIRSKTERTSAIAEDLDIPQGSMYKIIQRGRKLVEADGVPETVDHDDDDIILETVVVEDPPSTAVRAHYEPPEENMPAAPPAPDRHVSDQEQIMAEVVELIPALREIPGQLATFAKGTNAIIDRIKAIEAELAMIKSQVILDIAKALVNAAKHEEEQKDA